MADEIRDPNDPRWLNYDNAYVMIGASRISGVARPDPIYDRNLANNGVVHPNIISLFRDVNNFAPVPVALALAALGTQKILGRDHNVAAARGLTDVDEKFWIYGFSMLIETTSLLDAVGGSVFFDQVSALRPVGWLEWNFGAGGQQFFKRPLSAVPFRSPRKPVAAAYAVAADRLLMGFDEAGAMNLMVNGKPYLAEPQMNTSIDLRWQSAAALVTPTFPIIYQGQFEGYRLTGQKV